jgi:hypothetical protein
MGINEISDPKTRRLAKVITLWPLMRFASPMLTSMLTTELDAAYRVTAPQQDSTPHFASFVFVNVVSRTITMEFGLVELRAKRSWYHWQGRFEIGFSKLIGLQLPFC